MEDRKNGREKEKMEGKMKGRKKGWKNGCKNQRSNQMNQRAIFKKMKLFNQSGVKRECQPGTSSAKQACPTVKQSASGTRAHSKLRPRYESKKIPDSSDLFK